jgi:hypothetical protein
LEAVSSIRIPRTSYAVVTGTLVPWAISNDSTKIFRNTKIKLLANWRSHRVNKPLLLITELETTATSLLCYLSYIGRVSYGREYSKKMMLSPPRTVVKMCIAL